MNLFIRLFRMVFVHLLTRPKANILDVSRRNYQVWITDHDMFGHMNNSRYTSFMDIGMVHIFLRGRMIGSLHKAGLSPVVMGKQVSFYRPLSFPMRYQLVTQIVCWSKFHVLFQHDFVHKGKVHARGHTIGRLIGARDDRPTMAEVIDRCGWDVPHESPEPTGWQRAILNRAEAEKDTRAPIETAISG
ncbi:MAG: thioesterase family protein [Pseudomonadota bacterium]